MHPRLAPRLALAGAAVLSIGRLQAAEADSAGLAACRSLAADVERLACYDRVAAGSTTAVSGKATASSTATATAPSPPDAGGLLDRYWELSPGQKRGTFHFDAYRPNIFLPVHVTNRVNRAPNSPSPGHAGQSPDDERAEAKLQLSIRSKLFEDVGLPEADLWFAYTQQSLWQLYNGAISRPFRATDHEPELIYVVPTGVDLPFGLRWQMAEFGLAHQSNGQSLPLSRSWNRVYAMAGVERGPFAFTVRQNWRVLRREGRDDNPDLPSYRGRTDLQALWTPGAMTLGALWRTNFDSRGAVQLDWSYPVRPSEPQGLRWYAQLFSGYGETMLDYNFRQTSVGVGVSLFGW